MLSSSEIVLFLKNNKELLRAKYYCEEIGLFGSFARNEQTFESDIDRLVEFDPQTPDFYNSEQGLKKFLGQQFNRFFNSTLRPWTT